MAQKKTYETPKVVDYNLATILSAMGPARASVYGAEGGPPDTV